MNTAGNNRFSGPVTVFHQRALPEPATLAGYAALIDAYQISAPIPRNLSATGQRHRIRSGDGWRILTPRHAPEATLAGHLTFALKYEGLDLAVLKRLFQATGAGEIEEVVRRTPTGAYARRIWFLFEWLTGERLELVDAEQGAYVPVVDPEQQWATAGTLAGRQRVRNNLPGTAAFCPLVFRTKALEEFVAMDLGQRARAAMAATPRDIVARTAAFLLLKDSRASYAIEGERPPQDRVQRWGRAIGEAGRHPVTLSELLRLQEVVIGDTRFVKLGLREGGGFVGEHDRDTGMPLPDHISARPEDLPSLMAGLSALDSGAGMELDAVIAAAVLAFGFIYIHPLVDGNGRLHRYLMHHVLARREFGPAGVVFPVSAAILGRMEEYRRVLEDYSGRLLPVIDWAATADGNVRVKNDTADFYRYFDATTQAEFLYACVAQTVEQDLPRETEFLVRYDRFRSGVEAIVSMPAQTVDLLFRFLRQNGGRLSGRAREVDFQKLREGEVAAVEDLYAREFARGDLRSP
ncbi:MAG: Fic family protein [Candidatus Solibacter sp.]